MSPPETADTIAAISTPLGEAGIGLVRLSGPEALAIARRLFRLEQTDLLSAVSQSRNARRLMAHPDLRADVPFCLQRDLFGLVAESGRDGIVRASCPAVPPG